MSDPVVWKHIGLHSDAVGTFVCEGNRIVWKSAISGGSDDAVMSTTRIIPGKTLKKASWAVIGKSGHLRLQCTGEGVKHEYRFDGFPLKDFELLQSTLKDQYSLQLNTLTLSAAGAQYGLTNVARKNLIFRHCVLDEMNEEGQEFEPRAEEEMMSLDLAEVSQCVLPGNNRNEIEVQFPESDTIEAGTDQLVSIRMYIPPDPDTDPQDKESSTAAEILQQEIMATANIRKTTGDVLVSFPQEQGTFLTPRGRYAIELYDLSLRMRGQKYDYKIKYDDINRLFLLPKPDEVHMAFVIALDKPIRQGQQRYPCLVLQVSKEQDEVTINMDPETLEKEYKGELQPIMRGSLSNLIAKTFKTIAGKKVFIPGKFANANQQACVKCAVRANEGLLYPLEKQFVFIHKPAILVRFNEIESVEFQRYAGGQGSTRNFDLSVNLKQSVAGAGAGGQVREYTFSGIDRTDYAGLYNFLSGKKIPIKNLEGIGMEERGPAVPVYNEDEIYGGPDPGGEESSEDEDFDEAAAQEEEQAGSDDSEDSMDDDELGSEIDDELDSDLEDMREKAGGGKKKATKKKKPPKEDDDDDDEEKSPKKRKKKAKDPNAPKKAQTAYILYASKMRSTVKEDNPDASFGELTKIVSERFKALSDEERKKWDDRADADKQRYKTEMASYDPPDDSDDDSDGDAKPKKKAKKDPNAPKRGKSAYMFFADANRDSIKANNADASFGELGKLMGAAWKNAGSEEKAKFTAMAEKDKTRYQSEMKDYTPPDGSGSKGGAKKAGKKKDPDAPKRAQNAFLYFSQDMRPKIKAKNPELKTSEIGKKLGELYKELPGEEKEKYERMAQKDKQRYKKQMDAYKGKGSDDDDDDSDDGDKKMKASAKKRKAEDDGVDDSSDDDDSDEGSDDDDSDDE
eukprot:CAMPEP_0172442372 /NCGR_PEP_ID=MMETSP1065-20121228/2822_1 /TAXON_ID=265537 /ORGANISM="Amphiprora paludosa, Strain CCMP125" /LENGTH=905 /DNA_ID=CAMNT_0013192211 /DNA_START=91 /DNA_END=2808 /DNA_ORIENTATION=-